MDDKTFKMLMRLFNIETVEILGDAKFAVEVVSVGLKRSKRRVNGD